MRILKNRFRDRKDPYGQFKPVSLLFSVSKVALLRVVARSGSDKAFQPPKTAKGAVQLILTEIGPGFVKDVLISSTARSYEYVAIQNLTPKQAGRLMRGTQQS